MSKKVKIILALLLCLSVSFLIVYAVANYKDTSTLSDELKEEIRVAYYTQVRYKSDIEECPRLNWFDENGHVEAYTVWRYVGTYGSCVALLYIEDNQTAIETPLEMPYLLEGLSSDVYYPVEATVYLYNTAGGIDYPFGNLTFLANLEYYNVKWLSNAQLAQLTMDIAEIAKAYN